MLTVRTTLGASGVHGCGVFAAEFIPAGTVVWQFQPDFDFRVSEESVAALPEIARAKLLHYSAKWGGGYVISADDSRFINHSATAANLLTIAEPDCDVATRDIQPGEELLEVYGLVVVTFAGRPIERGIGTAPPKRDAEIQKLREGLLESAAQDQAGREISAANTERDSACRMSARLVEAVEQKSKRLETMSEYASRTAGDLERTRVALKEAIDILAHVRGSEIPTETPKSKILKRLRSALL